MRNFLRLVLLGAAAIACLATTASGASAACPNEALRSGASAGLPDCRAYEQVTPVEKNDQSAPSTRAGFIYEPSVSANGDRAAYFSLGNFAGAPAGASFYLSTRAGGAWSTENIAPALSSDEGPGCFSEYPWFSPDLSRGILSLGVSLICGVDEPALVEGEPRNEERGAGGSLVRNMFVRDDNTGTYQLLDITPPGVDGETPQFEGASPDLTHVVFNEKANLTPEATSGGGVYEWSSGSVKLVSMIPTPGETSCTGSECVPKAIAHVGDVGGTGQGRNAHAVSDDGSRVYFKTGNECGKGAECLFLREGDTTTQVDASQGSGASEGGHFMTASPDGSSVIFTDASKLTADSTATSANPDLYRYSVESGTLTDLTVDTTDANGADVRGLVAASEDASYLYFVADGILAANANSHGDTAISGQPNLYLSHAGVTTFIATLDSTSESDGSDWEPTSAWAAHVTPDGTHLAFNSIRSLTGYDNLIGDGSSSCGLDYVHVPTGNPNCNEVYVYDAGANRLACASCNPSGAQPLGASWLIGTKECNYCGRQTNWSLTRNISEDGNRIFFDSEDALVAGDTNGMQDVYEWERDGTGSCESSADGGGCVYLVSSGRSSLASRFYEAGANGNDVMFTTYQSLVGQDHDGLGDLYDARVDGGIASQNPPPVTPCSGEECSSSLTTAPAPPFAGSVIFAGAGNLVPAKRHTQAKGGKRSSKHARRRRLKRALKRCDAKQRHNRHKRRRCKRRVTRRLGGGHAYDRRQRHARHARRTGRGPRGGAR